MNNDPIKIQDPLEEISNINKLEEAIDLIKNGKFKKARKILKELAKSGDGLGMFHLGISYFHGHEGIPPNRKKGIKLFKKACKKHNIPALLVMSSFYLLGTEDNIDKNPTKAQALIKQAFDINKEEAKSYIQTVFGMDSNNNKIPLPLRDLLIQALRDADTIEYLC